MLYVVWCMCYTPTVVPKILLSFAYFLQRNNVDFQSGSLGAQVFSWSLIRCSSVSSFVLLLHPLRHLCWTRFLCQGINKAFYFICGVPVTECIICVCKKIDDNLQHQLCPFSSLSGSSLLRVGPPIEWKAS